MNSLIKRLNFSQLYSKTPNTAPLTKSFSGVYACVPPNPETLSNILSKPTSAQQYHNYIYYT